MNICLIPARGGSKRIPRKNVRPFNGLPMIAWPIRAARASGLFARIIVSTDDPEIAEVARAEGAEVPFVRPADLSGDHATVIPVLRHALDWLEAESALPDALCCLFATAPFVRPEDLRAAAALLSDDVDFVIPLTEYAFAIQRALRLAPDGAVEMFAPELYTARSQDLEPAYHDAGQFYWGKSAAWRAAPAFFGPRTRALRLPRHRVQDIDTPDDWTRAEAMQRIMAEGQAGPHA